MSGIFLDRGITDSLLRHRDLADLSKISRLLDVYKRQGVSYVYVVQDGKAVRSDVTIGLYTADTIAVTSGLTLGDEVITTWSSSLRDGVSVQTAAQAEDSESAQADPAASGPEAEG